VLWWRAQPSSAASARLEVPDRGASPVVANPNVPSGPPDDAWKVLPLVSLDYVLNGLNVPRDHSLPPYVPLMSSRNAGVREVSALSARWEIDIWVMQQAHKNRVESIEHFLSIEHFHNVRTPRPPGAKPDPTPPAVPPGVEATLDRAARAGLLDANKQTGAMPVFEEEGKLGSLSQSSAAYYAVQLILVQRQFILWNRAEALARLMANGNNSRGNDVEVKGVFEKGRSWGTVTVRNSSATDIEHITFALSAPTRALPPGNPDLDFLLGAAVVGLPQGAKNADEDVVKGLKAIKAGANLAGAVANDRAAQALPVRVFVHIPKLAPRAECEIRVFRSSFELARTSSAAYCLWADGIAIEGKSLPGYDEMQKEMQSPTTKPSGKPQGGTDTAPTANGDLFAKGSVWRGKIVGTQGTGRPVQHPVELVITWRDGASFRGKLTWLDARSGFNIEGKTEDGKVTWQAVANGRYSLLHTGEVKGKQMKTTHKEGEGNQAQEDTVTLEHVPANRR
jgi:hypothetical protein